MQNVIELNNFKIKYPASFDQLKKRDLIYLGGRFPYPISLEFYSEFFYHLCNFNNRKKFAVWSYNKVSGAVIETVLYPDKSDICLFNFLEKVPQTKNIIIPRIRKGLNFYFSYKAGFYNMSIGVFTLCESYFKKAIKDQDEEALNKMLACLYRPWWKILLNRNDYMLSGKIEKRANNFRSLSIGLKKGILLNYIAVREFVIKENPECFQKPSAVGNIFEKKKSGTWLDALYDLAGHITQFEKTSHINLWIVLRHLKLQMKKDQEFKAEIERLRKKKG